MAWRARIPAGYEQEEEPERQPVFSMSLGGVCWRSEVPAWLHIFAGVVLSPMRLGLFKRRIREY